MYKFLGGGGEAETDLFANADKMNEKWYPGT